MKIKKAEFDLLNQCLLALDSCILPRGVQNKITTFGLKYFDLELNIYKQQRKKLVESYAKRNEKGNILYIKIATQNGPMTDIDFDSDEIKAKCLEDLNKFLDEEIDLPFEPVFPDALGDAKIPGIVEKTFKRLGFIVI